MKHSIVGKAKNNKFLKNKNKKLSFRDKLFFYLNGNQLERLEELWIPEHGTPYLQNLYKHEMNYRPQFDREFMKKEFPAFHTYEVIRFVTEPNEETLNKFIAFKEKYAGITMHVAEIVESNRYAAGFQFMAKFRGELL